MKLKISILVFAFAVVTVAHAATNDLTGLLQKGLFEEEANRDLDAAISNYQTLAGQFDKDRQTAATAIFRLGECYRKLGKTNEAATQYQRILREFPDQQTLTTLSRQNLTGLGVSSDVQATQPQNLSADMHMLQQQIVSAQAQLAQSESMMKDLKSMNSDDLRKALPSIVPDDQLNALMQELNLAQQQLIELQKNYSRDHPSYKTAEAEVKDLNQKATDRVDGILLGLQAKINAETAYLDALKAKSQNAPPHGQAAMEDAHDTVASVTDDEQQEIRRIQVMIQDSPDLINSPTAEGRTPLQAAAEKGQLTVARYLLDHGAKVDHWGKGQADNSSPLYMAAANGHKAMVELLLSRGADVNGGSGLSPLFQAVSKGYTEVVNVLLANNADVNMRWNNMTPLGQATVNYQTNFIQLLLSHGAAVNGVNESGNTALHFAAQENAMEAAKILLASKANINQTNGQGDTPLHAAASAGRAEMISFLISAGATVDATNLHNATPLLFAVAYHQPGAVRVLLEHKADPNHAGSIPDWVWPNGNGYTMNSAEQPIFVAIALKNDEVLRLLLDAGANAKPALLSAINQNYSEGVQLLLEHGADPNRESQEYGSLLNQVIAQQRDPRIIKSLLDHGADPNVQSQTGFTPLMFSYDPDVVRWLVEHKADVNAKAKDGRTALMTSPTALMSSRNRWPEEDAEKYRILLENGANPDLQDADGNTALHIFAAGLQTNLVAVLLKNKANPNIQNNDGLTPLDLVEKQIKPPPGGLPRPLRSQPNRDEVAPQVADMLTRAGGLAHLPKRNRIEVRRGSDPGVTFFRGVHDWNHFTLLELIARQYGLLTTVPSGSWQSTAKPIREALWSDNSLPFPDFKNTTIYRRSSNDLKQKAIQVNVEDILKSGDCSRDVPLEWGDVVEIPEADHPVNQTWQGLDEPVFKALTNCIARQVTLKIKGETTVLTLSPEIVFKFSTDDRFKLIRASFLLRSALDNSKLLRVSSDLAHVKVTRHDPLTNKTQEWTINSTSLDDSDLWLRDGDTIEVPEK